jgi:hypothetical protein
LGWADVPPQVVAKRWRPGTANADVAMDWRWEYLFVVSTKFTFIRIEYRVRLKISLRAICNWRQTEE